MLIHNFVIKSNADEHSIIILPTEASLLTLAIELCQNPHNINPSKYYQMPELAEVETTRRGIAPHVCQCPIERVIIRHHQLRWPIPKNLPSLLKSQIINDVNRRGKYLLFDLDNGTMILHLGMSGCLRIVSKDEPVEKHDHVDIIFSDGLCLRYTDPRRFGSIHWTEDDPLAHKLLRHLGPEPLTRAFTAKYLFAKSRNRNLPIKTFIMDSKVVVGVGNIYAAESLFRASIHPLQRAGDLTNDQCSALIKTIKKVLNAAIKQGGTTLRDFLTSDGKPGYFSQHLQVYGRDGEPCTHCGTKLQHLRINQRSTVFCPNCQPAT